MLPKESLYLDLEIPSDLAKLSFDAELFLKNNDNLTVILDEIHRLPDIFVLLRGLIDQKREAGRFILLGSASPDLLKIRPSHWLGESLMLKCTRFTIEKLHPQTTEIIGFGAGFRCLTLPKTTKAGICGLPIF